MITIREYLETTASKQTLLGSLMQYGYSNEEIDEAEKSGFITIKDSMVYLNEVWQLSVNHDQLTTLYDALHDRLINLEDVKHNRPAAQRWHDNEIEAVKGLMKFIGEEMVKLPADLKTSVQCDYSPSMEPVFRAMEGGVGE